MQSDLGTVCLRHVEFMNWADEIMLAALSNIPSEKLTCDLGNSFQSLFGTLAHIYLAEVAWLRRVQGNGAATLKDFESPADLDALSSAWAGVHREWIDWAASRVPEDWLAPLFHRTLQGKDSRLPYWQVVFHLVNHGSYHRGQLATMLRQSGIVPPGTDQVTFFRTHPSAPTEGS
jgi:uncharacterized damage-inducible protein DinB